ncbi:MAG: hypothetical protein MR510_03265 [Clostridium sp.]|nr:hypothetical protein [Clostridium sp.]
MQERPIKKETIGSLSILLPVEIYKDFEDKCTNLHLDTDKAIEMLI